MLPKAYALENYLSEFTENGKTAVDSADEIYRRGMTHLAGDGVPKDPTTAFKLFRQAAEQGHVGAHYQLGQMLRFGEGTCSEIDEAVIHYLAAAKGGNTEAMVVLGSLFELGDCLPLNLVFAHAFYSMALEGGVADISVSIDDLESRMSPYETDQAKKYRGCLAHAFGNGPTHS